MKSSSYVDLLRDQYTKLQTQHSELEAKYDLLAASTAEGKSTGFASQLVSFTASLCEEANLSDTTFVLKNGERIPAHRWILACRGKLWSSVGSEINVDDSISPAMFHVALRWLYTDVVDRNSIEKDENLLELTKIATNYRLEKLLDLCTCQLTARLNVSNCVTVFEFAETTNNSALLVACSAFIANEWSSFTPAHFENLSATSLYRLLNGNSTNVLSSIVKIGRDDVLFLFFMDKKEKLAFHINEADEDGRTPLAVALENGNFTIAEQLVQKGADVDKEDSNGSSLLEQFVRAENLEACQFLTSKQVNLSWAHKQDSHTILHTLAGMNDVQPAMAKWATSVGEKVGVDLVDSEMRTALMRAVEVRNEEFAKILIELKANVNISKPNGSTALSMVLLGDENWSKELASSLVEAGADVDVKIDGTPLLSHVIRDNRTDVADFLLGNGVSVRQKSPEGSTPIHEAVKSANEEILKKIFEHRKADETTWSRDNSDQSPLDLALTNANLACAKILLSNGASVNEKGRDGRTPVLRAIQNGEDKVAVFLLDNGAEHTIGDDGKTCLEQAAERGLTKTLRALLSAGAPVNQPSSTGFTILERALANDHTQCADLLVSFGCDVECMIYVTEDGRHSRHAPKDAPWSYQQSLLHHFIDHGNQKAAVFLIQNGCDVNARKIYADNANDDVATPAHLAVTWNQLEVLHELVVRNADLHALDSDGRTPCHVAIRENNEAAVRELLKADDVEFLGLRDRLGHTCLSLAISNKDHTVAKMIVERQPHAAVQSNKNGENLLHTSIRQNDFESVLFLLGEAKSDSTKPINDGTNRTPLHLAAIAKNEMIIRNLILAGGEVNVRAANGSTPLHEALRVRNVKNATVLLENGADVNMVDEKGDNALLVAVRCGSPDCIKLLLEDGRVQATVANFNDQTALHLCSLLTVEKLPKRVTSGEIGEILLSNHLYQSTAMSDKDLAQFLDAKDADGNTALLLAYMNGNAAMCKLLLKRRCCLGSINNDGVNVFTYETATKQLLFGLLEWLTEEPRWSDGAICDCGAKFTLTVRKHHCRHCGRHVCAKCSETTQPLPKFGEEKKVRLCDLCAHVLSSGGGGGQR